MSGPRCVLGITGNIASGKSTVVRILVELGATHIDADIVYRELVSTGQPLLTRLAEHFGPEIVGDDGSLDRQALGAIVFADPEKLRELDALTHPAVIAEIDRRVTLAQPDQIVVIDAVKLIESGHAEHCDEVWVVTVGNEQQVTRLMKRNILSEVEAKRRIASQPPMAPKLARADRIIDNSGSIEETRRQVETAWNAFLASQECTQPKEIRTHGRTVQG
jgi:dephospho-CoA kinase